MKLTEGINLTINTLASINGKLAEIQNNIGTNYEKQVTPEKEKLGSYTYDLNESLRNVPMLKDILGTINEEGLISLMEKCKIAAYFLGVKLSDEFPRGSVQFEIDTITKFQAMVRREALRRLEITIEEVEPLRATLKKEAEKGMADAFREYYQLSDQYAENVNTIMTYMSDQNVTQEIQIKQKKIREEMNGLVKNYPILHFIKRGNIENKAKLNGDIDRACDEIKKAQKKVDENIKNGMFPVWQMTPIVNVVKEYFTIEGKEEIDKWIKQQKTEEMIKDIFEIGIPIACAIACFFMPGGASISLLMVKTAIGGIAGAIGVVDAIEEYRKVTLEKEGNYAQLFSAEDRKIIEAKNLYAVDLEYIVGIIGLAAGTFDLADAVRGGKLLCKLGDIDSISRKALRRGGKEGVRLLEKSDIGSLNVLGRIREENIEIIIKRDNAGQLLECMRDARGDYFFRNINSMNGENVIEAMEFFPGDMKTNILWLEMENIKAKEVLTSSQEVIRKYNDLRRSTEVSIEYSDSGENILKKLNTMYNTNYGKRFSDSEKVALLKESVTGNLPAQVAYIRVSGGSYSTISNKSKPFAWVTDPYILAGKNIPSDFKHAVGFTDADIRQPGDTYLYVTVFKDAKTADKYVNPKIIDWDDIKGYFKSAFEKHLADVTESQLQILAESFPSLIEGRNINDAVLERDYFSYFRSRKAGTEAPIGKLEKMEELILRYTGASELFTAGGVTYSSNGLGNIEKAFMNGTQGFDIKELTATRDMNIFTYKMNPGKDGYTFELVK